MKACVRNILNNEGGVEIMMVECEVGRVKIFQQHRQQHAVCESRRKKSH